MQDDLNDIINQLSKTSIRNDAEAEFKNIPPFLTVRPEKIQTLIAFLNHEDNKFLLKDLLVMHNDTHKLLGLSCLNRDTGELLRTDSLLKLLLELGYDINLKQIYNIYSGPSEFSLLERLVWELSQMKNGNEHVYTIVYDGEENLGIIYYLLLNGADSRNIDKNIFSTENKMHQKILYLLNNPRSRVLSTRNQNNKRMRIGGKISRQRSRRSRKRR